jgi:DNA invertase Pin-like site-specific DNA recombinase
MPDNGKRKSVAYLRTSSAANVGEEKDSAKRQTEAIYAYAGRNGIEVVASFYDAAVSGADPLDSRPGFADLLAFVDRHNENGGSVRAIIVETANRFARDLIVQETGYAMLKTRGIDLIAADSPGSFLEDTPTAIMVRQILGAVAQFEKASTVAKLRAARDRKRAATGKCEGRRGHAELRPEAVALAKRFHRRNPKTGKRRSLRIIAAELAAAGYVNEAGRPFHPGSVRSMLAAR